MITYQSIENGKLRVYLDGARIGTIVRTDDKSGFYYQPNGIGKTRGETFKTVAEVKASIE